VTVTAPKLVSGANFPMTFTSGGSVNKLADVLSVLLSTAATTDLYQGTVRYPLARLTLQANRDQVSLTQLRLTQYGAGIDSDAAALYLYADTDHSGDLSAADQLAAPVGTISGGVVTFAPSTPILVRKAPQTYFIVVDVSPGANIGDTLGMRIASVNGILVVSPDSVSNANLPTQGPLAAVLDPHVPRTPLITITSAWSSSPTRLSASWTSSVPQGSLVEYDYAIGTTAGGTDIVPYTSAGVATAVTQSNLFLRDGQRYYFSVKARSDAGKWSAVSTSQGILIDSETPFPPNAVNTFVDGNSIVVTWPAASAGPSGIGAYRAYLRPGSSPSPVLIGSTTISDSASLAWPLNRSDSAETAYPVLTSAHGVNLPVTVQAPVAGRAASTNGVVVNNLTPGTYYFSVQSVSNAGLVSDRSAETQVLFGLASLSSGVSSVTNYPNPFDSRKGVTTINYTLNQDAKVDITIYDVYGGKVKHMSFDAGQTGGMQGSNNVTWDGTDGSGNKVSKGMYLGVVQSQLAGGNNKVTIKIGVMH
jgi:hypothetical protein